MPNRCEPSGASHRTGSQIPGLEHGCLLGSLSIPSQKLRPPAWRRPCLPHALLQHSACPQEARGTFVKLRGRNSKIDQLKSLSSQLSLLVFTLGLVCSILRSSGTRRTSSLVEQSVFPTGLEFQRNPAYHLRLGGTLG